MAVGFRCAALVMRITRSSMLEVLRQDYIRTARAKGASEQSVNYHHALKNAVLPVITIIGIEAAFLIGGLIVTETVFNIPGVARFLVEAIRWRDYPIVQNLVMFIAVVVVSTNFLVDMLYAALDPRIRYTRLEMDTRWPSSTTIANCDAPAPIRRMAGARLDIPRAALSARRHRRSSSCCCSCWPRCCADFIAPLRSAHRPIRAHRLAPPERAHWLGADFFGRDIWSRIVHGARISLAVGVGSTLLGSSIGVIVGLASGYLVRLGRPGVPAHDRHPAGAAAAGAGAGHDRGARAVAAERRSSRSRSR